MRAKVAYVCGDCGVEHPKWQGQCSACGKWNTLREFALQRAAASPGAGTAGYSGTPPEVARLAEIETAALARIPTGMDELDRVLGGGFVPGSVVLIGGDPGAGKSTLLLQVAAAIARREPSAGECEGSPLARKEPSAGEREGEPLARKQPSAGEREGEPLARKQPSAGEREGNPLARKESMLYVSGEESLQQIADRARRLALPLGNLLVAAETRAEAVAQLAQQHRPSVIVIDSIQVMHVESTGGVPGSVTQVRESAALLTKLAKQTLTTVILVGHVTKEGNLAGPKVLEHMIDCFVMLDSPAGTRFRTLRSHKNRFGAVNELGVFAMTETGMKEVANPSAIFLQRPKEMSPGSVVTVTWEGTRPLLVELQALVDESRGGYPRRITVGLDPQRIGMHLAALHRHCGLSLTDQDVFANVVGGVRISETGADLATVLAVLSSFQNRVLPRNLVCFGELGLTGEVRAVPNGQERLREAQKHGFDQAIAPRANLTKTPLPGIDVKGVTSLAQTLEAIEALG